MSGNSVERLMENTVKKKKIEKELYQASNLSSSKARWALSTLLVAADSTAALYLSRQSVVSLHNSNS